MEGSGASGRPVAGRVGEKGKGRRDRDSRGGGGATAVSKGGLEGGVGGRVAFSFCCRGPRLWNWRVWGADVTRTRRVCDPGGRQWGGCWAGEAVNITEMQDTAAAHIVFESYFLGGFWGEFALTVVGRGRRE